MGVTVRWDCNGDSLPSRVVQMENGRKIERSKGKHGKRFDLQGILVCPPSPLAQGRIRGLADRGTRLRVPVADVQERPEVVGPGKRGRTATLPGLSLLPI